MTSLVSPVYCCVDYDRVCALRRALLREFAASSRHFGATDSGFTTIAPEPECDLPLYIGVYGEHPEHGEIVVFWPRETVGRDHGFWAVTKAA